MEGPYFKAGSPARGQLVTASTPGQRLTITGVVLNTACRPAPGAALEFWQANAAGHYDSAGFNLRGHQTTGADGRYRLETVVPGLYAGRTRHVHVKVTTPGGTLTTQLYFPGEARNANDMFYDPALLLNIQPTPKVWNATFDFVVRG